eukprot:m.36557 g.36557  ORF g.36557 m.36557 type:complete len:384 (+) comp5400_c0_seq2:31-1182(+)
MAQRRILQAKDMDAWRVSPAYAHLMDFVQSVCAAVKGRLLSDPLQPSPMVAAVVAMLARVDAITDQVPPEKTTSARFGNPAFRTWHAQLSEIVSSLVELPGVQAEQRAELAAYLLESFGNQTRIDYGSGHELAFAAFLCCLRVHGLFTQEDLTAVCFIAFNRYLAVVRRLQQIYHLEPAGSHGVWGLDDFQFLPFYWGAGQLIGSSIPPAQIPDPAVARRHADDSLFFSCIAFIFQMKTGPFHEHSRMLYDISAVPEWAKVTSGLLKMYVAEVLMKFPIVQHFLFGPTLRFDAAPGAVPVVLPDRSLPAGMPIAGAIAPQTKLSQISGTGGPAKGSLLRRPVVSSGPTAGPSSPSAAVAPAPDQASPAAADSGVPGDAAATQS